MPTIEEYDEKIDAVKQQLARLEERKKAQIAKEREQARKWRAATTAAIGEMVLETLDVPWEELDLGGLRSCLADWVAEHGYEIRCNVLREGRTAADAKHALDAYKTELREARRSQRVQSKCDTSENNSAQESVTSQTDDYGENPGNW